jgi:hypothetical protein
MKATRLEKIYITILMVIFGGIVLHAPLSVGLGVLFPKYLLIIKSWKEIVMVLFVPLAIYVITRYTLWRELLRDWIFRLIALYVLLHVVISIAMYQGVTETAAGLAIDLRYILFFALLYVGVKVLPQYRRRLLQIGIVGAFIVVGFATAQLFLPADILSHIGYSKQTIAPYLTVDENTHYIRVNSTLRGPNPLGAYAGMVLALIMAAFIRAKLQLKDKKVLIGSAILFVCSIVALWISYSRSALIGAGIGVVIVGLVVLVQRGVSRKVWLLGSGIVLTLAVVVSAIVVRGGTFISNVFLHINPNGGSAVNSNTGHVTSLETSVNGLIHHPFGIGVGSTGSASLYGGSGDIIENQYLFVGHEIGWLGLALFIILYVFLLVRLWHTRSDWLSLGVFASGIGLGFIGLLLPVWADDTVSIVWWGLAAIALAGGGYERQQAK